MMRLAVRTHFLALLIGNIGDNHAVHAAFLAARKEFLCAVGINRIRVGQKYQRHLRFLAHLAHEVKNLIGRRTCCQRAQVGTLDNLALSHRIGERNAKLNQSGAALDHRHNQLLRQLQIRIACCDKADKNLFLFVKCFLYSIHVNQLPYSVQWQQRPCRHGQKYLLP